MKFHRALQSSLLLLIAGTLFLFAADSKFQQLPVSFSNNAVALVKTRGQLLGFSFMGIGAKKTWDDISNAAYSLDMETGKWSEMRPVPGTAGRIAAGAVGAREHAFLFGG